MTDFKEFTGEEFDEGYVEPYMQDATPTDKVPKFWHVESLNYSPEAIAELRVDQLVKIYIEERNQLATDRRGFDARETQVKEHMSNIALELKRRADVAGVNNMSTEFGTAFRRTSERFPVENWEDLSKYVLETGNVHVLQKRVAPNAVREIREQDGSLPPGVGYVAIEECAVRSPVARRSSKPPVRSNEQ